MAPRQVTAAEEAAFMTALLSGLDESIFSCVPSPDPSPIKPATARRISRPCSPLKPRVSSQPTTLSPRKLDLPRTPRRTVSAKEQCAFVQDADMDALMQGADTWDWEDMFTPKKPSAKKTKSEIPETSVKPPGHDRDTCTRCTVETVEDVSDDGRYQKNVTVLTEPDRERRLVVLRDDWTHTVMRAGDTINVIGTFASTSPAAPLPLLTITSQANLLIHHPDLLLTATAIAGAPHCTRRPLLQALVRSGGAGEASPALVWGNMLHEVVQRALHSGQWAQKQIEQSIDEVVRTGLAELVRINVDVDAAVRELRERARGVRAFAERYIAERPKADAVLSSTRAGSGETARLAITRLLDVEEDIWSPTYGLKGKLDASVHAVIAESVAPARGLRKPAPPTTTTTTRAGPMPFEIKTGRAVAGMEHRAQTLLYTLLMGERYGTPVDAGLLYYTQSEEVVAVPRARNELRGLVMARNELARWMMVRSWHPRTREMGEEGQQARLEEVEVEEPFLPRTIDDERVCKRCFALDSCMLYRKAVEGVVDTTSPIAHLYALKTGHLTVAQNAFFKKWEALLALEESDLVRFKKELWTLDAPAREARGRAFAHMRLDRTFAPPAPAARDRREGRIHQFTYRFVRAKSVGGVASLLNGHMAVGDAVTVSVAPDLFALARGYILELAPASVVLGVDHVLDLRLIAERLARGSDAEVEVEDGMRERAIEFRIDRDELFGGMGRMRDNLAQLFYSGGDAARLALLVDLQAPRFAPPPEDEDGDAKPDKADVGAGDHAVVLNANQRQAMDKVLRAEDYALILGMPGTGKTTVIAAVIRTLVRMGKTVLLTSYTHSAVDTILLKLQDDADFGILRLGNVDKVHPDARKFTLTDKRAPTTVEQLEHQIMTPPVVATTCLSIDHPLFSRRRFDYCIVDEASQITLPTCLGPLRFADKFVLVGDHFQLPPLVKNPRARKGGLDVSLFRRLSEAHPHAVIDLNLQYRMNADIMLLSNRLIYGGRLRCGSDEVANRSLKLPNRSFLQKLHSEPSSCSQYSCWLEKLLAESCKAVFVDTDSVPALDSRVGDLVQNEVEATLVRQVTEALLQSGVDESQIGIISPYRQQIKLLAHGLRDRAGVEILTADRSQGRDKDCIIISMVRSNETGQVGELVKDWRRMNVSFTRARAKLVIFGSRKTLQAAPLLKEFFELMDGQGWITELPAGAHTAHAISSASSGTPGRKRASPAAEDGAGEGHPAEMGTPSPRPVKKAKASPVDGLLKTRPILRDIVHNSR